MRVHTGMYGHMKRVFTGSWVFLYGRERKREGGKGREIEGVRENVCTEIWVFFHGRERKREGEKGREIEGVRENVCAEIWVFFYGRERKREGEKERKRERDGVRENASPSLVFIGEGGSSCALSRASPFSPFPCAQGILCL